MKNLSENKLESKDNNIHSTNKELKQPGFLESNDSAHNLTIQPSITLAKEGKSDLQINIKTDVEDDEESVSETPKLSHFFPTPAPRKISPKNYDERKTLSPEAQQLLPMSTAPRKTSLSTTGRTSVAEHILNLKRPLSENQLHATNGPTLIPRKKNMTISGLSCTNPDDEKTSQTSIQTIIPISLEDKVSQMPIPAPRKSSMVSNSKVEVQEIRQTCLETENSSLAPQPNLPVPAPRKVSAVNARQGPKTLPRKHIYRFLIALTPLKSLLHCIKNIASKQSNILSDLLRRSHGAQGVSRQRRVSFQLILLNLMPNLMMKSLKSEKWLPSLKCISFDISLSKFALKHIQ